VSGKCSRVVCGGGFHGNVNNASLTICFVAEFNTWNKDSLFKGNGVEDGKSQPVVIDYAVHSLWRGPYTYRYPALTTPDKSSMHPTNPMSLFAVTTINEFASSLYHLKDLLPHPLLSWSKYVHPVEL